MVAAFDINRPVAVLSDIHGNLTALEAVLADLAAKSLDQVVVLGDLVGKGPNPAACVDRVMNLDCPVVVGNWDLLVAQPGENQNPKIEAALEWQQQQLGATRMAWLLGLPFALDLERRAGWVRLLHASPQSIWHRVGISAILSGRFALLAGMFENTERTSQRDPVAVGYGDIHQAFVMTMPGFEPALAAVKGKTLFNVGSVGNPMDMPVAVYAILGGGPGLEITLQRVPYNLELECQRATDSGMPDLAEYLEETRFARYRPRGA